MAFKLTYSDGQETDYDDNTKWEVENGVVKLGRGSGKWTVFLSPSHWATLEIVAEKADQDKGEGSDETEDNDQDEGKKQDKADKGDDKGKEDKDKEDKDS